MSKKPLADRIRPESLSQMVGQKHLIAPDKAFYKLINSGNIVNMIFYGPSGTGKTTLANIAAKKSGKKLYKLNATNASVADIKAIIAQIDGVDSEKGILLYLDEIQNFNKKQQQSLLEFIENGKITLIASTTENPYFYIYNAILSRSTVFEFLPLDSEDIKKALKRGLEILSEETDAKIEIEEEALLHICQTSGGDVRKALNVLELCVMSSPVSENGNVLIDMELCEECSQKKAFRYDRDGDSHYDVLSAFHKSVRGSDPDAAVHYLARLIVGGDLQSICRRLLAIASEDVGLSYPQAAQIAKACVDSALMLGFPEAKLPLTQATIMLATAPKSNSVVMAIDDAISDVIHKETGDVPVHLKDAHYSGAAKMGRGISYKYPHNYENNYVKQQYLPDKIKGKKYYQEGNNKNEQAIKKYWEQVKGEK